MIRPPVPLAPREEELCHYVLLGYSQDECCARMGCKPVSYRAKLWRIAQKLAGPRWAGPRLRIIMFYSMEIGVRQYLAGLRGDDGKLLAPPEHVTTPLQFPEPEQLMKL